ncbi:MAG: RsmB/NOP family class I SAM-dependent RNA methyltransferase [Pseudobdellovibrionaceae bacterium]
MVPSARLQAVIDILTRLEKSPIPMDLTVGDYMRQRRFIGSKDRADIVMRVYGIIRYFARIRWVCERQCVSFTPRFMVLVAMAMIEGKGDIDKLFDGSKFGPEPLTDDEKKFLQQLPADFVAAPDVVKAECPPEYEDVLRQIFGENFTEELAALGREASLDLRVNVTAKTRDEIHASLREDGVETEVTPYSPWGLRVKGKVYLSETKDFRKGHIEIQDEGSQLIALACNAAPGMQVLDYCAGGGGKTMALAAAMKIKGRIVAMDLDENRLKKARERFRRAKVSDIIEVRPLADEKNRKWLRRQKQTFDVVLADVPCSGTGTWRRNPDTKWRRYGPTVEELVPVQAEILDKVAGCVKPGGRLVYATCSLLPAENEDQIARFLGAHPEFELAPLAQVWPEGCTPPCAGNVMRLSPLQHQTDGFFATILLRKAD